MDQVTQQNAALVEEAAAAAQSMQEQAGSLVAGGERVQARGRHNRCAGLLSRHAHPPARASGRDQHRDFQEAGAQAGPRLGGRGSLTFLATLPIYGGLAKKVAEYGGVPRSMGW